MGFLSDVAETLADSLPVYSNKASATAKTLSGILSKGAAEANPNLAGALGAKEFDPSAIINGIQSGESAWGSAKTLGLHAAAQAAHSIGSSATLSAGALGAVAGGAYGAVSDDTSIGGGAMAGALLAAGSYKVGIEGMVGGRKHAEQNMGTILAQAKQRLPEADPRRALITEELVKSSGHIPGLRSTLSKAIHDTFGPRLAANLPFNPHGMGIDKEGRVLGQALRDSDGQLVQQQFGPDDINAPYIQNVLSQATRIHQENVKKAAAQAAKEQKKVYSDDYLVVKT